MSSITVVPCYGRDYKTAKAAKDDFNKDLDFTIANFFHPADGKPCNKSDLKACKEFSHVMIRYNRLTKTVMIKL